MEPQRKETLNWEEFGKQLLWHEIVYHKNDISPFEITDDGMVGFFSILSNWPYGLRNFKRGTWKEVALALGVFNEYLISDGHDCNICPERKDCTAYFKDDPDQERCSGWIELKEKGLL
jgi:hypothetical protein